VLWVVEVASSVNQVDHTVNIHNVVEVITNQVLRACRGRAGDAKTLDRSSCWLQL
jgi:hypothetical protein